MIADQITASIIAIWTDQGNLIGDCRSPVILILNWQAKGGKMHGHYGMGGMW